LQILPMQPNECYEKDLHGYWNESVHGTFLSESIKSQTELNLLMANKGAQTDVKGLTVPSGYKNNNNRSKKMQPSSESAKFRHRYPELPPLVLKNPTTRETRTMRTRKSELQKRRFQFPQFQKWWKHIFPPES
ncbi:5351_t:CDS:2, partial [Ambispora gerdemannii]